MDNNSTTVQINPVVVITAGNTDIVIRPMSISVYSWIKLNQEDAGLVSEVM